MDDFVSWDDFDGWWPRLEEQVLAPYLAGHAVTYQRRDWAGDPLGNRLGGWRALPPTGCLVLEGVTSSRREVANRLDYAVWVEAPREVRLDRGVDRDGYEMRPRWLSWIEREAAFFDRDGTRDRADLRVNGNPSTAVSEDEYEVGA
jgi:hypothetical protein